MILHRYALSQPRSFDWNNRVLGNRYNVYNPYNGFGYSSYMSRDMMWNDWVWGYHMEYRNGWSYSWGNNSWSSNQLEYLMDGTTTTDGANGYGWNNNGWNNGYRRGSNVAYNIGRRGSTMSVRDRIGQGAMIQSTKVKKRRTINIMSLVINSNKGNNK